MKILLFGKNGQVGWELQKSLAPLGQVIALGSNDANFEFPEILRAIVRNFAPDFIVNAAAYTAVDKAEEEPQKAKLINDDAVRVLAEEAHRCNAWFVHYSTDYVFDGNKKTPYVESDQTKPLSVYGRTKRDGELGIAVCHDKYIILRVSWVYGIHGKNFAKTILSLAETKETISVVDDQFGAPTNAAFIADVTSNVMNYIQEKGSHHLSGIYHLAPEGRTTWYKYAVHLITHTSKGNLKLAPEMILPVSSKEYQVSAKRPLNSCMSTVKLKETFGLECPAWEISMTHFLNNLR